MLILCIFILCITAALYLPIWLRLLGNLCFITVTTTTRATGSMEPVWWKDKAPFVHIRHMISNIIGYIPVSYLERYQHFIDIKSVFNEIALIWKVGLNELILRPMVNLPCIMCLKARHKETYYLLRNLL